MRTEQRYICDFCSVVFHDAATCLKHEEKHPTFTNFNPVYGVTSLKPFYLEATTTKGEVILYRLDESEVNKK